MLATDTADPHLDTPDVQAILRELANGPFTWHRGRQVCLLCGVFRAFGHREGCLVERAQQALGEQGQCG